jgi:very-short-patch-repair endonuclease
MNTEEIISKYKSGHSSVEIAEMYGTYENKIIRILKKFGVQMRNKKEAQELALKNGRSEHPTRGKKASQETREKQSEAQATRWQKMPEEKRESLRECAQKHWESRSDESKQAMLSKAGAALQKASKEGSKAEKYICKMLRMNNYNVVTHLVGLIPGNYELDIFLPELKIVIELDGPQHFIPIFGDDLLNKNIRYDSVKNGLLISSGFTVIRVKYIVKHLSQKIQRDLWAKIKDTLDNIENGTLKEKLIEVEING